MASTTPRDRRERRESCAGFQIRVVSYELFDRWYASADDVDPGAVIARSTGSTREQAEDEVLSKARARIAQTRSFPLDDPPA